MNNKITKETLRPKATVLEYEDKKKYVSFKSDFFAMKWNATSLEDFGKKLQKLVDSRKNLEGMLNSEIAKKMKFISIKDIPIDIEQIDYSGTIITFADEIKKKIKLDEVPKQKTINEVVKEKKPKRKPTAAAFYKLDK